MKGKFKYRNVEIAGKIFYYKCYFHCLSDDQNNGQNQSVLRATHIFDRDAERNF